MRLRWMAVLLVLLTGCGTTSRVVRLDTGQGRPILHTVRGGQEPVKLREDELQEKMPELVRDVRPSSQPLRFARSLMFQSWQEAVYLEWTGRSLVPSTPEAPRLLTEQDEFTRGYGRWCERRGRSRDCFSLLKDTPTLDADGRYTLAMAIATDAVWNETKAAFTEMADPEQVRAAIVSSMAMYMMLWLLPEPVSKGLAATLTAGLIAYLGVDTVWSLMGGWIELVEEVNRATTFEQLREAGERYGKVMGRHAARAFVLLATAAIGSTAGLGPKGPGLPGYSRAAVLAETQGGFRLAAVGGVRSVAVSAEGAFTIALAPGAVAMSAQGPGAGNGSGSNGNAATVGGSGQTNSWTNRTSPGGTKFRFNTGHGYNRPHEGPGGISKSFSGTGLTVDEIETAIMQQMESFRASGGTLPVPGTPGFNGPFQGSVTVGTHQVGFRAVMLNTGEIAVSTYFPL
jgi:hypothetical protein